MLTRLRVLSLIALLAVAVCLGCSEKKATPKSTTSASRAEPSPPPPPPLRKAQPQLSSGSSATAKTGSTAASNTAASASAATAAASDTAADNTAAEGRRMKKAVPRDGSDANYRVVRVFYATDRAATGNSSPAKYYGVSRQSDETLHLGTLDVSIPHDHRMGHMERASIWRLEFRQDPEKHIVLLSVTPKPEAEFYTDLSRRVALSPNKDAFVFIHGFDNTFEQAALRTAQLAYDLKFQGAPILYSWPSRGKVSEYAADEATIDWAAPHLEKFLETVAVQSHATTVHLIAHSMGNRALTRALVNIALRHAGVPPMFRQVFLAAPDIDADVFRQLAATFPSTAAHVTLYASSRDEALAASAKIHSYFRAGDARHICIVPHVDTIDASAVDTGLLGHAYYGDNRSILSDIFEVMQSGAPPNQRFGMHAMMFQELEYWAFQP